MIGATRRSGLLWAGILVAGPGARAAEMRPDQIVRQYGRAVVLITTADASDAQAFGTGFIVSPDGLVVTNYHVIEDAVRASVHLTNGRQYPVRRIVRWDRQKDLAVLQINAHGLPTVRLGDSGTAPVGARVYVLGNPEGFQNTLSDGLLSARRCFGSVRFLQISAPISPGSSGSPVFNAQGRVIGVASATHKTGQNLNLAMPIGYARFLIQQATAELVRTAKTGRGPANQTDARDDTDRLLDHLIGKARRRPADQTGARSNSGFFQACHEYAAAVQSFCPRLSKETAEHVAIGVVLISVGCKLDERLLMAVLATEGFFDRIEWRQSERDYYVDGQTLTAALAAVGDDLKSRTDAISASTSPQLDWGQIKNIVGDRRAQIYPKESVRDWKLRVCQAGRYYYQMCGVPVPDELESDAPAEPSESPAETSEQR